MSPKNKKDQDKGLETIETTLTKSEQFIEKNQKMLMYIILGLVSIAGIYWAYQRLYKLPRENDALSQMFVAERNFELDSFKLALNGTLNYPGFISITEDYSGTKAANLSNYYIGVCYLNLRDFEKTIEYMKDFRTDDIILSSEKNGIIGDSYVELDDFSNAVKYYKEATSSLVNDFTTPLYLKKLGLVYEKLNKFKEASETYQRIYDDFPNSNEARTIEKYIKRAKLKIK